MRSRDERGSVAPLIIGLAAVVVLLVAVVVDASAAYLRRQGLAALSDAAALAATEGLQGEQVYAGGLGEKAAIDPATAKRYVAQHLREAGALRRYPGLRFQVITRNRTVVVRLRAPLRLPLPVPGVVEQPTIAAAAASEVVVSR